MPYPQTVSAAARSKPPANTDRRLSSTRSSSASSSWLQSSVASSVCWREGALLRRLSVFAGGFDLAAAETVCGYGILEGGAAADVLARLVEKSLVAAGGGRELRYRLLETVRIYAAERLGEAGEADELARRQARWALAQAERDGEN